MLIGRAKSVSTRVTAILLVAALVTAVGILLAFAGGKFGLWPWPLQSSSRFGVLCGLIGGFIVLFEMALLPKKWLRGWRLGSTRLWMAAHVWLGLACLPVILVHAAFGFGGPLTTVTLILFLAVIASGVWGLAMQQWVPQKILLDVPGETVASQVDFTGNHHAKEATKLVLELIDGERPTVVGKPAMELRAFLDGALLPYLERGARSRSPLAARSDVERRFARFREIVPGDAHGALDRLEQLCDLRRQWDLLARLHVWLHGWLLVHLPLSVAMTGLMILHAVRALKYW